MATSYQMSKGSSKSHKSLEPTKEQAKNYVDKEKTRKKSKVPYTSMLTINIKTDAEFKKKYGEETPDMRNNTSPYRKRKKQD